MDEFALGMLVVVALAGLSGWLTWKRETRPSVLWTWGWLFLFAAGAITALAGGVPWADSVVQLLGPFFPALMLAGALAHAGRPVPAWLVPLAFLLGALRWGFGQAGQQPPRLRYRPGLRVRRAAGGGLPRLPHGPAGLGFAGPSSCWRRPSLPSPSSKRLDSVWGLRGLALTTPHFWPGCWSHPLPSGCRSP